MALLSIFLSYGKWAIYFLNQLLQIYLLERIMRTIHKGEAVWVVILAQQTSVQSHKCSGGGAEKPCSRAHPVCLTIIAHLGPIRQ